MRCALITLTLLLAPTAHAAPPLGELVRDYLQSAGADRRLEDAIVAHPDASPRNVIATIRSAELWLTKTPGIQDLSLQLGAAQASYRIHVSVPASYTIEKRWPLIVALHGSGGRPEDIMGYVRSLLGPRADEFIIAAPEGFGSMHLRGDADETNRPRDLVVALRREFRIDDRRVHLMGYSLGGHNTWLGGVLHADLFAGLMPLATPLQVVGNEVLFPDLLPNLRNTYTLFCWGENDNVGADGNVREDGGNAAWNRHMSQVMREVGVRGFRPIELAGVVHGNVRPPADAVSEWLNQKRRRYPKHIQQMFRLPENSAAYWARCVELQAPPLADGELRIRLKKDDDLKKKQRQYMTQKLGVIEASVEGQSIRLRSRNAETIELLLHDKLIDLDQPVTILRGSRELFHGKIPRDLRVLLREAANDWDFDRFFTSRVVIRRGRPVRFNDES
ncbi:MAG TPA: hypothetical protein P5081_24505 [Phycisphaerae bacterium]|nr:hypothetical protein [Phycisphaerae bacterium]HRW56050.1 hypothetical protein [Phycisphaerae bacterium]